MSYQHIDSYFKDESHAQGAMIKIQMLGGTECSIEEIAGDVSKASIPTIAFAGSGATDVASGAGIGAGMGAIPNSPIFGLMNGEDDRSMHALLRFLIHVEKKRKRHYILSIKTVDGCEPRLISAE